MQSAQRGNTGVSGLSAYLGSAYLLYGSLIRVRRYLRGEISGVRQYERFVPMKQVVSTGWWSRSVSARTACTCSPVRTLSSKLLYLRFVFARFIQGCS